MSKFAKSSGWRSFISKMYGIGASLVILGALFKLQHWPYANIMLIVGLGAEAFIFFISAFDPVAEEYDWTRVYPQLGGAPGEPTGKDGEQAPQPGFYQTGSISQGALSKFDKMIESAEITPELFSRLGEGLKNLNLTVSRLADISDASLATNEYVSNIKKAAISVNSLSESIKGSSENLEGTVNSLSDSYKKSSDVLSGATGQIAGSYEKLNESINASNSTISDGNRELSDRLTVINKNLSTLNSVYELQLKSTNDHVNNASKIYGEFDKISDNLLSTVKDTEQYKHEMNKLTQNLVELNSVYGNMLSAMNVVSRNR